MYVSFLVPLHNWNVKYMHFPKTWWHMVLRFDCLFLSVHCLWNGMNLDIFNDDTSYILWYRSRCFQQYRGSMGRRNVYAVVTFVTPNRIIQNPAISMVLPVVVWDIVQCIVLKSACRQSLPLNHLHVAWQVSEVDHAIHDSRLSYKSPGYCLWLLCWVWCYCLAASLRTTELMFPGP